MPTIPLKFGRQDSAQRPVSLAMFMMAFVLLCASSAHAATFYVSTSGNNANSGTDWSQAKQSVQAGINASQAGDQVWVAQGTYTGLVTLKKSVAVYGGFNGTETQLIQRSNTSNLTILDGNQQGSVVTTPYDTTIGPDTLIDGFTIRNGSAQFGGGVLLSSVSPTISNNMIIGNFADNYGGGIFAGSGSATIKNNTVIGNTVRGQGYYGGGIMCSGGNPTVIGNTIKYNKADNGGGIYYSATGTIANNKIIANMAGQSGAGIYVQNAQPIIKNNVIYANVAMPNGQAGGIGLSSCSSATISGNLIFANLAYQSPGVQSYLSQTTMINNTVVNNQGIGGTNGSIMMMGTGTGISTTLAGNIIAYNQIGLYASPNVAVSLSHNDVFGNTKNYVGLTTGLTDVSVDPLFADLAGANFHLLSDSPVIDAGDDSYYVAGDLDLVGNSRFSGLHIDMGAYEFASSTSAFSLTTLSPASTTTDAGTAVTLTLTGTGFVSGSVAFWNGAPLATTAISSTQLTAQVPAALVASIDLAT